MNLDECFKEGLLQKTEPSIEKAKKSIENAEFYLTDAELNFKMQRNHLVIFCCYTSMFHAARALLFRDGIKERSHICLIKYIKEKYPALQDFAILIDSYRRSRHSAIYGLDYRVPEIDAKSALEDTKKFIREIKKLI